MNRTNHIYCQATLNAPLCGTFARFTSTGKEKDVETGYNYHGARYYDAELLTSWTAVDPLADKYLGISSYAYCAWNPVKLVDSDGMEAMENVDWYKDGNNRLRWNPSVTKETALKEGEEYLGETVLLSNNEGQTVYGDKQGKLHASIPLAEVNITADITTKEKDANVPVSVPVGAVLWDWLSTAAGAALDAATTIAWIMPACLLLSGDSSPNQDIRGGHDNNVRKSTKGKHEGGDSRRLQDQQGSKGEKIMKGKRPQGYKGPWPPKKKK